MIRRHRDGLQLRRETLRNLTSSALRAVAGGDSGSLSCGGPDCGPRLKTDVCPPPPPLLPPTYSRHCDFVDPPLAGH